MQKKKKKNTRSRNSSFSNGRGNDNFISSYEWRRLRFSILKRDGARCACCGATPADGAVMNVDHIKPRKKFPHLALDPSNLQVLCHECNHGKGNWDQTNFRGDYDVVLSALDRISRKSIGD